MLTNRMNLYQDLQERGIIKQVTDLNLESRLHSKPIVLYAGFDPSSDSLHIGNLLPLLTLRRFQLSGHSPLAVVGGATGLIGDPSGKTQERPLLSAEVLEKNLEGVKKVMSRFLDFHGKNQALILNNADWFKGYPYIDFLRDVGKHFTVNYMISKESVSERLENREQGISYTEFSYMLVQAYDFLYLNKNHQCCLQIGGSDQWGNITAGCELIRKTHAGSETPNVFGLTLPLVQKSDGTKFGKTEKGAIWLDAHKTSPYQMYQFFIQTSDADVISYLKYFTFISLSEINELAGLVQAQPEKREAQKVLASHVTRMVHGDEAYLRAEQATKALFGSEIQSLDAQTLLEVFSDAPSLEIEKKKLSSGVHLVDLITQTALCTSKGLARKEIEAGGIYVNNIRVSDVNRVLKSEDLIAGEFIVLRKGKKNYHLIAFK